jgi:hypothetical protein
MMRRVLLFAAAVLFLAACDSDDAKPYMAFGGGGFVYNYRIGDIYYGFVAQPQRRLPVDAELVARFEDPAGGPEIEVREPVVSGKAQYMFRTPPVKGVAKDRPYKVSLALVEQATGREIESIARTYTNTADPAMMPDGPLVVGPGYTPNPALSQPAP